jgi:hypothetical protein
VHCPHLTSVLREHASALLDIDLAPNYSDGGSAPNYSGDLKLLVGPQRV